VLQLSSTQQGLELQLLEFLQQQLLELVEPLEQQQE
jgi:hypothetical protein